MNRITQLTPRGALIGLHIGALMFGLSGIFGKLILAGPLVIVFGRALFGSLSLAAVFAGHLRQQKRPTLKQAAMLLGGGVLLCTHWLTFFLAVKVGNVAVATLASPASPPSPCCWKACCSANASARVNTWSWRWCASAW